jgi:hypothetical protein
MKNSISRLAVKAIRAAGRDPFIYLAGKIRKHCWRHRLVSGLRQHSWDDGCLPQSDFTYVGPFFVGCDHGCFHNNFSHGSVAIRGDNACPGRDVASDFDFSHLEVVNLCLAAVTKADLLFCYIDSNDCHGTVFELGYALAQDVPFVIAFAPGVASAVENDFWFVCEKAQWVIYDVNERELSSYLMGVIRRYL